MEGNLEPGGTIEVEVKFMSEKELRYNWNAGHSEIMMDVREGDTKDHKGYL